MEKLTFIISHPTKYIQIVEFTAEGDMITKSVLFDINQTELTVKK